MEPGEIVGWDTRETLELTRRAEEYPCKPELEFKCLFFRDHPHSKLHVTRFIFFRQSNKGSLEQILDIMEFSQMREMYVLGTEH